MISHLCYNKVIDDTTRIPMTQIRDQIQTFVDKKLTFHINDFRMEDITNLVYGKRIPILESPNDTSHKYTVTKQLDEYDQETLDKAIRRGGLECWQYDVILKDLCAKGYIDPGEYFLRVSW